jgi:hypothetical protein
MKCRRPLYHRSGEQDDGTRRCGEVMRRGTHNGGVCMALLVPGFVQHLKLILYYTIALKDESRCCTARCQDGGVIRMAALSLRGDNPPFFFFNPSSCLPLGHTFSASTLLVLFCAVDSSRVLRWTSRTAIARGQLAAAESAQQLEGPVYVRIVCTDRG